MSATFCNHLSQGLCTILTEVCFRYKEKTKCEFQNHYNLVLGSSADPPRTQLVKQKMMPLFIERWKDFAKLPSTGKKSMTGIPLEKAVRETVINELSTNDVIVPNRGRQFKIWEDVRIIADVIISKNDCPTSIISVKSWIGPTQIRETFAYAYFSKAWHGQKNMRLFMVTLHPLNQNLSQIIDVCKPYIDGVYSLSSQPYFDTMIQTLSTLYSK